LAREASTPSSYFAEIGQSKSWASRLHARAVERLKEILDEEDKETSDSSRRKDHGRTPSRNLGGANRPAEAARPGGAGPKAVAQQVRPGAQVEGPGSGPPGEPGGSGPARP